jgi:hypothetical protein
MVSADLRSAKRARYVAGDRRHFNGMGQARAQVIAGPIKKNLGLVLEPAKRPRVDDAIAIALVLRSPLGRGFRIDSTAGIGAELGIASQRLPLSSFQF